MKRIFCISGHPDTMEKVMLMKEMVSSARKHGKVCVVSHYPVSVDSDYYIYDNENMMVPMNMPMFYANDDVWITYDVPMSYNGLAVYSLLCNACRMFTGRYDVLYFIESDNSTRVVDEIVSQVKDGDWQMAGVQIYTIPQTVTALGTTVFAVNLKNTNIPWIGSWDEFVRSCNGSTPFLELMLLKNYKVEFLDNIHPENRNSSIGEVHEILCEYGEWAMLFHVNLSRKYHHLVDYDLDDEKMRVDLPPRYVIWRSFPKHKKFNGKEIIFNKNNRFKFMNGMISPNWSTTDDYRCRGGSK